MKSCKQKYQEICQRNYIPIFSKPYWMDAVCGEQNWDVILAEENGNILGCLVFYLETDKNGRLIRKAPLTQNNGIIYFYPENLKYERKLSFEYKVSRLVINQIENLKIRQFRQYFHYNFTNWLPFYWNNYNQTTRYTYIIDNTKNLDDIYKEFSSTVRNAIRKASKKVFIKSDLNKRIFYDLNKQTFIRQGIDVPYSYEFFDNFYSKLVTKNIIKTFYAEDSQSNIHSAVLLVEDENSVYYIMSGSSDEFRDSQSLTLLIYESIKYAHLVNKKFDFEGSMKENIEHFNRQFGAKQVPYFDIYKDFE